MRFERTEHFNADVRRLSKANQELFRPARGFNDACDVFIDSNDPSSCPARLRVKTCRQCSGRLRNDLELQWSRRPSNVGMDHRGRFRWITTSSGAPAKTGRPQDPSGSGMSTVLPSYTPVRKVRPETMNSIAPEVRRGRSPQHGGLRSILRRLATLGRLGPVALTSGLT